MDATVVLNQCPPDARRWAHGLLIEDIDTVFRELAQQRAAWLS
jgi:hypothetical protein